MGESEYQWAMKGSPKYQEGVKKGIIKPDYVGKYSGDKPISSSSSGSNSSNGGGSTSPPPTTQTTKETRYVYVSPSGATHVYSKKPSNWNSLVGKKQVVEAQVPKGTSESRLAEGVRRYVKEGKSEYTYNVASETVTREPPAPYNPEIVKSGRYVEGNAGELSRSVIEQQSRQPVRQGTTSDVGTPFSTYQGNTLTTTYKEPTYLTPEPTGVSGLQAQREKQQAQELLQQQSFFSTGVEKTLSFSTRMQTSPYELVLKTSPYLPSPIKEFAQSGARNQINKAEFGAGATAGVITAIPSIPSTITAVTTQPVETAQSFGQQLATRPSYTLGSIAGASLVFGYGSKIIFPRGEPTVTHSLVKGETTGPKLFRFRTGKSQGLEFSGESGAELEVVSQIGKQKFRSDIDVVSSSGKGLAEITRFTDDVIETRVAEGTVTDSKFKITTRPEGVRQGKFFRETTSLGEGQDISFVGKDSPIGRPFLTLGTAEDTALVSRGYQTSKSSKGVSVGIDESLNIQKAGFNIKTLKESGPKPLDPYEFDVPKPPKPANSRGNILDLYNKPATTEQAPVGSFKLIEQNVKPTKTRTTPVTPRIIDEGSGRVSTSVFLDDVPIRSAPQETKVKSISDIDLNDAEASGTGRQIINDLTGTGRFRRLDQGPKSDLWSDVQTSQRSKRRSVSPVRQNFFQDIGQRREQTPKFKTMSMLNFDTAQKQRFRLNIKPKLNTRQRMSFDVPPPIPNVPTTTRGIPFIDLPPPTEATRVSRRKKRGKGYYERTYFMNKSFLKAFR